MSNTINFGIDLGTTNSLIAKYQGGKVELFKNPIGLKDTLPSVVGFRKERTLVGDKAKEYVEKDPENVFSLFKRKMGTSETYEVKNLGKAITPIELSSWVLRELKNFVYSGEVVESVVITIPASFDTIQSNATKKAGYEAGFKEVVLLQEPIAASLAFANKNSDAGTNLKGQWLVYDLGGGTFDVALLRFENEEIRVVDHEGDNFFGGLDFDNLIIENIVLPYLKSIGSFNDDLIIDFRAASGKYNRLYRKLLYQAEEIKIQLSNAESAELEFDIEDNTGETIEVLQIISREAFERCIREKIVYSTELIENLLTQNGIGSSDIEQVVLIGGSTYIPLVRQIIQERLGIRVNATIDPTNAVAVGAAYYAGGKTKQVVVAENSIKNNAVTNVNIQVKTAYQKTSQDSEEYFTAALVGDFRGMTYRISREGGGYDSGMKQATDRISEILPLLPQANNVFTLKFFDQQGNLLNLDIPSIEITQGKFNIFGQPLPNDICIEVDDFDNNTTKLEVLFEKNALLPLKKTFIRTLSKNINKGSDESLLINVLEGNRYAKPSACLPLGIIEIGGKMLETNIVKGSDVEITLEVSESRDLKINVVLLMNDQEVKDTFSPSERYVSIEKLKEELRYLYNDTVSELRDLEENENFDTAAKVLNIQKEAEEMLGKLRTLAQNDTGDSKYQLEERKRKLAQQYDLLTQDRKAEGAKKGYFESKRSCESWLYNDPNNPLKAKMEHIIANERQFLASNNISIIKRKAEELDNLAWAMKKKDPQYIISLYHYYSHQDYPDRKKAQLFIEQGEKALDRKNYDELLSVIYSLYALLPPEIKEQEQIRGTGLR